MKKNTWKKLMSLALGAMMMLSLLTGCGTKTAEQVQQHHGQNAEMLLEPRMPQQVDRYDQQAAPQ